MKRICILVTQLERAGSQKNAISQARYFHQEGYQVHLCFLYDKYGLLSELNDQEPFPVISFGAKDPDHFYLRNVFSTLRALGKVYFFLKRQRVQVLECLTFYSNILGIFLGWFAGVPLRISSQRRSLIQHPRVVHRLDALWVNSCLVDKMIVNSENTRSFCIEVEGMDPEKLTVIYNGIDTRRFDNQQYTPGGLEDLRASLDPPEDPIFVTTVARLHPQKGHKYLIRAASDIVAEFPNTLFLFVGEGEEKDNIRKLINELNLSHHFRLLGVRKDVPDLLALSKLFVLPSLYEGMPNAVLEAMAARLPVVASDVDGISEVVLDGETGYLVPKKNPRQLKEKIVELITNDRTCQRFGERGYKRVKEHFSERQMCENYEGVMRRLWKEKFD